MSRLAPRRIRRPLTTIVALIVAATATLCSVILPAHAADEITFSTQPSSPSGPDGRDRFDYQVAPGTVISDWIGVSNYSPGPITVRVYAADATTDYDTGQFTLIGSNRSSAELGAWTSVNGGGTTCADETPQQQDVCALALGVEVTIPGGQRVDIPFTVTVPHDARPGDHSAGIVAVYTSQAVGADGNTVKQEARQGTRVYLRVDGPLEPAFTVSGLVAGFDSGWVPFGTGTGAVGFDVTNTGNVRMDISPVARLSGPFGIDLGQWELPGIQNLVPNGVAHVAADFPGIPPLLLLTSEVTVVPDLAEGQDTSDLPAARYTSTVQAWAIPWTGVAILALLVGGFLLWRWQRNRRRTYLAEDLAAYREQILAEERDRDSAPESNDATRSPR